MKAIAKHYKHWQHYRNPPDRVIEADTWLAPNPCYSTNSVGAPPIAAIRAINQDRNVVYFMRDLIHTITEKSKMKLPFVVGISGIDGSGKGYIGSRLAQAIEESGRKCELIGIDGWLQPPEIRFAKTHPGEHFYYHGFRFDEMLESLFVPLAESGSINLWAKHSEPTNSSTMVDFHYSINSAEILIFEGIFIFQKRFNFDYRIWVECSYETALKRALQRNQEGLPEAEVARDYNEIYFPAQRIHIEVDDPRKVCDYILLNDNLEKNEWP